MSCVDSAVSGLSGSTSSYSLASPIYRFVAGVHDVLLRCKWLQGIALFSTNEGHLPRYATLPIHPRFVILEGTCLQVRNTPGEDHWAKTDDFLAKRRSGETKRKPLRPQYALALPRHPRVGTQLKLT